MQIICLVTAGILPIPATKGGAIETLVGILIDQNELMKKVNFIVISVFDAEAYELSKDYKFTKFIYIKNNSILSKIYQLIYSGISKIFKLRLPYSSLYYYKGLKKAISEKFDYIVAEGGDYLSFDRIKRDFGKEKIYLHLHHHIIPNKKLDDIFNGVISVSNFISNEWKRKSTNLDLCTHTVYNCIDEEKFSKRISIIKRNQIRVKLGFTCSDFIAIFCGRIIEVKGVKELIKAINNIPSKKIKLLIIGSPNFALSVKSDYLFEVTQLVNESGDKIKFLGYIPNEQLYQYYQIADIQVVPSLCEEAAGLVLIEGMSSGLPLIITKSGGMVEYASSQCSIQLDKNDELINNLSQSIEQLYDSKDLYHMMQDESSIHAKRFRKESFYLDFINVFETKNFLDE